MPLETNKLAILFGAGAEQSFGLPDGGEFAISLFTQNYDSLKSELRKALDTIQKSSSTNQNYMKWLDYTRPSKNKLSTFGKNDFEQVIMSSAEQKKQDIKDFLISIDDNACSLCKKLIGDKSLTKNTIYEGLKKEFKLNDSDSKQIIKINPNFSNHQDYDGFFTSNTILLINRTLSQAKSKQIKINPSQLETLQECFNVLLFMVVMTCSDDLLKELNTGLITSDDETTNEFLSMFEQLFTMKYDRVAGIIYDFIQKPRPAFEGCSNTVEKFINLIHRLTFKLCSKSIDYQMLIDNYFRYIMSPKTEWPKFTKMFLFLSAAYNAITSKEHTLSDEALKKNNNSYYQDIIDELNKDNARVEIKALASTNYHDYYGRLVKLLNESEIKDGTLDEASLEARFGKVMRLNGGVGEFYNPYKNSLVKREPVKTTTKQDNKQNLFLYQDQLVTPFFFTQSGIKPITAIDVSCLYTEMYSKFKESDIIVVIGFNFNSDDNHINTIIRDLVENHNKTLVIVTVDADNEEALKVKTEDILYKLRIDPTEAQDRVKVLNVDSDSRKTTDNQDDPVLWLDYLANLKINNEPSHQLPARIVKLFWLLVLDCSISQWIAGIQWQLIATLVLVLLQKYSLPIKQV